MNATDVIGWTYDADWHCTDCTQRRFGTAPFPNLVPEDAEDAEGNPVHPIFGSSEWWEPSEDTCQTLACSDCHAELDEVHASTCEENYGEASHPVRV